MYLKLWSNLLFGFASVDSYLITFQCSLSRNLQFWLMQFCCFVFCFYLSIYIMCICLWWFLKCNNIRYGTRYLQWKTIKEILKKKRQTTCYWCIVILSTDLNLISSNWLTESQFLWIWIGMYWSVDLNVWYIYCTICRCVMWNLLMPTV